MSISRRGLVGGAAALAATPALAQSTRRLRMVTSWPRGLPGPGVATERMAQRIEAMSGGRLSVELYAAEELVPALEVFDAVAQGVAELGHSASFFWTGKAKAAVYFTTVPFGLTPREHVAWIEHGGGQELWDELYGAFGLKPFMAGNTGMHMAGWFKEPVRSADDLVGLRIRIPGIGAEIMRALGAVPVLLPPGEIVPALQRGTIDAAEFLGPWSDRAAGFQRVASHYGWPSFTKPNGTGEAIVNLEVWEGLGDELRAVIANACAAEAAHALGEADWHNAVALRALAEEGVEPFRLPDDVLAAAREVSADLLAGIAAEGELARRIHASYARAARHQAPWSEVSEQAFLAARGGA
jgi:TRAP-type mannitol/chloroaromatic compound transport system substrate-binding protein